MASDASRRTEAPDAGHVPMTEELDSARWTLPPVVPVLIAFLLVGAIVAFLLWQNKPQATVEASLDSVNAALAPGSGAPDEPPAIFVVARLRVKNTHEKPLYLKSIRATLESNGGQASDEAASAADLPRYFKAVPALAPHQGEAMPLDQKIATGTDQQGVALFRFPIPLDAFEKRTAFTVRIELFDRTPIELKEKR